MNKTPGPSIHQGEFDLLITMASWEERFVLGLQRILSTASVQRVSIFQYEGWVQLSQEQADSAEHLCKERDLPVDRKLLPSDSPVRAWKILGSYIENMVKPGSRVLVDISTMPREAIWTIFYFLQTAGAEVVYAYHRPESYSGQWISGDPGKPRLIYKLAGEARLGKSTVLLVATGFDWSRTAQLIWTFEPDHTLMAMQEGDQFDNQEQNVQMHQVLKYHLGDSVQATFELEPIHIDAYSGDRGRSALEEAIKPYLDSSNIVMASLGPKLSAVSLYEIQRSHPETSLVYTPAGQYNPDYSKGIGTSEFGMLCATT